MRTLMRCDKRADGKEGWIKLRERGKEGVI